METKESHTNYLMNFWKPKVGDKVFLPATYSSQTITAFFPDFEEQVLVSFDERVFFLQDCSWNPTMEDCFDIIKSFGVLVTSDGVRHGRTWHPLPKFVDEFPSLIRNIRWNAYLRGEEVLERYFDRELT